MKELTDKEYEDEFQKYLDNGINWEAHKNAVIKVSYESESARGDVEQFAYDSFWYGATFIMRKYGINWAKDEIEPSLIGQNPEQ